KPSTTSLHTPSLSCTSRETIRAPKLVNATSIPFLFLKVYKETSSPFIVSLNCTESGRETNSWVFSLFDVEDCWQLHIPIDRKIAKDDIVSLFIMVYV